jgi:alpha-N-acetylglucosamine transferase
MLTNAVSRYHGGVHDAEDQVSLQSFTRNLASRRGKTQNFTLTYAGGEAMLRAKLH